MTRPLAYITAVWCNAEKEAKEQVLGYCREVYEAGYSPICSKLMHTEFLKDNCYNLRRYFNNRRQMQKIMKGGDANARRSRK